MPTYAQSHSSAEMPFGEAAHQFAGKRIVVIPCGGDDGKRPLVRWRRLTPAAFHKQLPNWLKRLPGANLGIACGPSRIVVVDIDDPGLLPTVFARFGETPLITRTGSGGYHAYFDNSDAAIGCYNLRKAEKLPIDIKGAGGVVIAPPSRNPATGGLYVFHRGSWADLQNLPPLRTDSLPTRGGQTRRKESNGTGDRLATVGVGQRNDALFQLLLREARSCDDLNALLNVARTRNDHLFEAPLPDSEVLATAQSAWRYEVEGHNWVGRSSRTILAREDIDVFAHHKKGGDGLILWTLLNSQHKNRKHFVVDREAMAAANVITGWTAWRYRKAIEALCELGILIPVSNRRRRADKTWQPTHYRLVRPTAGSLQYVTRTVGGRTPRAMHGDQS